MTTRVMRVPEEMSQPLRALSGVLETTPQDILGEAFREWRINHQAEIQEAFDHAKKYLASADTEGLVNLTREARQARALRAASVARRMD